MKYLFPLLIGVLIGGLILGCGCTEETLDQNLPASPATTEPTSPPGTTLPAPTETFSLIEQPTDEIDSPNKEVIIKADRNPISVDPSITIEFRGGKGQYFVTDLDVIIYLSNGQTVNEQLGRKVGDEVVVRGTTGTDRVIVFATFADGTRYRVFDEALEFGS